MLGIILLLSSFICWKKARERRKVKLVARDPITGIVLSQLCADKMWRA